MKRKLLAILTCITLAVGLLPSYVVFADELDDSSVSASEIVEEEAEDSDDTDGYSVSGDEVTLTDDKAIDESTDIEESIVVDGDEQNDISVSEDSVSENNSDNSDMTDEVQFSSVSEDDIENLGTSPWYFDTDGMTSEQIYTAVRPCGTNLEYYVSDIGGGVASYSSSALVLHIVGTGTRMWDVESEVYDGFFGRDKIKEIDFSNCPNLEYIGAKAFRNMDMLEDVILPASLESMGTYAFSMCDKLKTVSIPCGMTTIPNGAFFNCPKLEDVDVRIVLGGYKTSAIGEKAFSNCQALKGFSYRDVAAADGDIKLKGISTIGVNAFSDCTSIVNVYIPSTVSTISAYCFKGCSNLIRADVDDGTTKIESNAFSGCVKLKSMNANGEIVLPSTLSSMEGNVFNGCTAITRVTFPAAYRTESSNNFVGCTSLYRVDYLKGANAVKMSNFANCTSLSDVYIYGKPGSMSYSGLTGVNTAFLKFHAYDDSGVKTYLSNPLGAQYISLGQYYNGAPSGGGSDSGSGSGTVLPTITPHFANSKFYVAEKKKVSTGFSDSGYSFKSSNTKIATVSATGVVSGKAKGSVTITATKGTSKYTCKVYVCKKPFINGKDLVKVNKSIKLKVKQGGGPTTWVSSNPEVATVEPNGKVHGIKKGKTTIFATNCGIKIKKKIKVK